MFYLNSFYDPFAQNFYRYSIACLRRRAVRLLVFRSQRRSAKRAFAPGVLCHSGLAKRHSSNHAGGRASSTSGPAVFTIFMRSSVIMTAVLALIFFPEERSIIRQWQFQAGTILGLFGAIGVVWFQPRRGKQHISLRGLLIVFTAALCWALYGVLVKRPSAQLGTVRSFAVISFITSALLAAAHPSLRQHRHAPGMSLRASMPSSFFPPSPASAWRIFSTI